MQTERYNVLLRIVHWLMAVCILGLIAAGMYMTELPKGDEKWWWYGMHKSFGVTVIGLLILRLILRFITRIPPLPKGFAPMETKLVSALHFLLYAGMVIVPISGFIMSDAGGHAIAWFGYALPDLIPTNKQLGGLASELHEITPFILLGLIALHVAGAIKHQFGKPENKVFYRMWFEYCPLYQYCKRHCKEKQRTPDA